MQDSFPSFNWVTQLQQSPTVIKITATPDFNANVSKEMLPYQQLETVVGPALSDVADYLRTSVIPTIFKSEGPGWQNLAKRTQKERQAQGYNPTHPILRRTGDLFAELTSKGHPNHIESIQTSPGRFKLTIGGSSTKFVNNQLGRSDLNLPARPMLPGTGGMKLNPADAQKIQDIFTSKVAEQLGNA
jgi:hypothetical protein